MIKPVDALTISFHRSAWSEVPLQIFFLFLLFFAKYIYCTFRAKRSFICVIERYQLSSNLPFHEIDDRRGRRRFWSRKVQRIITTATTTIVRTRSNLIRKSANVLKSGRVLLPFCPNVFNRAIAFITRSVPVSNCTVGKKSFRTFRKTNENGERKERPEIRSRNQSSIKKKRR